MLLPSGGKDLIKVVQIAKQGYNIHGRAAKREIGLSNHRVNHRFLSGALLNPNWR